MYLEGPRAVDVFYTRDKAAATGLAQKIASALALPAPRTHARRETMQIPEGAAVALVAIWFFAVLITTIFFDSVRGPAASVSDWPTIVKSVAPCVLFLTVSARWLVRRPVAPVERSEPHPRG